ncbi:phage tail protein [Aquimarina sp. 2201CG5-10]|uniref:phage tail protein n=1 Tax=Aquimarina callyspongiae TaxID=3098150 RepID=UPI002AB4BD45|nr:tail fiber protein [Aquimarina sp. 2201CG5-10]MDY8136799.1 tail fiber protein [Aquimarina sp. 2201CG5-10]
MLGTIGEVRIFAGNFAPRNWAFCEGQLQAISQNDALFSILGTIYGGDGRTTFALPDLRGRVPIGPGHGPGLSDRRLGARSGTETNTLNVLQMPSHTHFASANLTGTLKVNEEDGVSDEPRGQNLGLVDGPVKLYNTNANDSLMAPDNVAIGGTVTIENTGGNQSVNNMQPWLACYYIICLFGTYPSRS